MPGFNRVAAASVLVSLLVGIANPARAGGADGNARVRHLTLTFVDRGRPTEDPTGARSAPTRTLVTEIYVPRGKGPFPLVAFAHGFAGHPGKLTQLLSAWARAGYVVAAPAFPLTNDRSNGAASILVDYVNQPADLRFVLDRVLQQSRRDSSPLYRRVDPRNIGLAGHSLGGVTAYGATFNTCCRDRRIDALVVMDGRTAPFGRHRFEFRSTPLLLIHLTGDPLVSYSYAQEAFAAAKPHKYLMTLSRGVHFEPFEDVPNPHDEAVTAATIAFWDAYLGHERAARRRIVRAGTEAGLSTVTARTR